MSVFAGGCELPAFATVCLGDDDPPAVDVLDELVRTSFVTVDFRSEPARYRLLQPVRQYAAELLDGTGDGDDRRQRHLLHYLDVARAQTDDEHQPDHRVSVERLERELGNFRVALDWAAAATERTEAGLWLAFHLQYLWISGTHHAEGVGRIAGLLRSGAGTPEARSAAARVASIIEMHRGDGHQRLRFGEQAVDEAIAATDRVYEGRARQVLSRIYWNTKSGWARLPVNMAGTASVVPSATVVASRYHVASRPVAREVPEPLAVDAAVLVRDCGARELEDDEDHRRPGVNRARHLRARVTREHQL